jgi:hypothetical protein
MAGMAHAPHTHSREPLIWGIFLIGVGLAALAATVYPDAGTVIVLVLGLGLLTTFAVTREYGALVPGGILTGLGAGLVASTTLTLADEATGGVVVAGLGLGFLSIWLIGLLFRLEENHPWPLIPGAILTTVGAALLIGDQAVELLRFWPLILIALGVGAIGKALLDRNDDTAA